MRSLRVLVSGASIAGPSLAYWLDRYGCDVTIVEKAPEVRPGGQAIDFKGPIHLTVLRQMGILEAIQAASIPSEDGLIINSRGRKIGSSPGAFIGGDINIPRGEVARILYERTRDTCEYVFGDSITSLTQTANGVDVTFARRSDHTFDLVFGADGMHSNVRRLAFGPETDYVDYLGYYYALADIGTGDEQVMYSEPGRTVILGGPKASAFFVFASPELPSVRDDVDLQKQQLVDAFRGGRWRIPELLDAIADADDFYLDSISRATVDHYSDGRVAILGDAAWGNALGGFGTGLAIVGAFVLAGELQRADGDHHTAFPTFDATYRNYASVSEKINGGRLLAPRTRRGILLRNTAMTAMSVFTPLIRIADRPARNNLRLENYDTPN